jgi:outer membrane murein-binding lipoprotein Lpp
MKHWIAAVVVALMLSGCSQKAAFEEMADGTCTNKQAQLVEEHISGQIDAIAKEEWESAYSFASPSFRMAVDINRFVSIISSEYGMLVENQGYEFNGCTITNYEITQEVGVTSESGPTNLTYMLSVKESVLGVDSAVVVNADTQLNA